VRRIWGDVAKAEDMTRPAVDDVRVRRGRLSWAVLLGVATYILVRFLLAAGRGEDSTGPYALLDPGIAYPCAPIHYVVSEAEAPSDFVTVVHGAVGKISAASGYRFFFDGMTPDRDFDAHLTPGRAGPVLVGFATATEVPQFAGDVIGLGRSVPGTGGRYTTGVVMLDATKYRDQPDMAERQAIVMHELGHVLGLDHVDDAGELMNRHNLGRTTLGPGDLAGLRHQFQASCPRGAG
jgi:hypothetical protein